MRKQVIEIKRYEMRTSQTVIMLSSLLACASLLVSCGKQPASNSNSYWPFTFEETEGNATLDTQKFTIVFEGEEYGNRSSGSLQVSGSSGPTEGTAGELEHKYSNGVCAVKFRTHAFRLIDGGNQLSIQGTDVDLSQTKKIVTVKKDGSITSKDL